MQASSTLLTSLSTSARGAAFPARDPTRLYGGDGPHGVLFKTVGAGLAYSNGLRGSASQGQVGDYAERTPELSQTNCANAQR